MTKNDDVAQHNRAPVQGKSLSALQPGQCRWPIGDPQLPGFHFCGEPKAGEGPYCAEHASKASTPSRPRQLSYKFRSD